MKLNTDYIRCAEACSRENDEYMDFRQGAFYELINTPEKLTVYDMTHRKVDMNERIAKSFETTPDGNLRMYQMVERVF
jgi:hypothetical protein